MVAIGRSSHAFFFDGVSESIIIPQGRFTKIGQEIANELKSGISIVGENPYGHQDYSFLNHKINQGISIEAWIVPDCGGVILHRDEQFTLSIGNVDTPGPAKFTVVIDTPNGKEAIILSTADELSTRYSGVVYPVQNHASIHDQYNRFDSSTYGKATNLNYNHRPLIHILAGITVDDAYFWSSNIF